MDARRLYGHWVDTTDFDQKWSVESVDTVRYKTGLVLAEPTDTPGVLRLCYGPIEIGEFIPEGVRGPRNATIEALAQIVFSAFFDSLSTHQQLELVEAGDVV